MESINLQEAEEFVIRLIKQAGEIALKYFNSGDFTHRSKGGMDFVTDADLEVDNFLKEKLQQKFPQSNFLTEESAPKDYSSLKSSNNLWVIDPIDGTTNFSRGHSNFAISIALVDDGQPKLGAVYLPALDLLYLARDDQDYSTLNGEKLKVSSINELGKSLLACDWAWGMDKRKIMVSWIEKVATSVRQIKCLGSAAADLSSLAAGKIDIYLNTGLKPWDYAAAGLIAQKAGAKITLPNGDNWDIFNSDVLVTNGLLQDKILQILK